jgi:hypothetical protein
MQRLFFMMLQLDPPLPMITPRGPGLAHFLIDYGAETHLLWSVFLDDNGECWTFPNPDIRMASNPTMGRRSLSEIKPVSRLGVFGKTSGAALDASSGAGTSTG